jgi:hypothetical protein
MAPESSLDRFLAQRGQTLLYGSWRRNTKINLIVGVGITVFGLAFLGIALALFPPAAIGAIGPLFAGAINVGVHFHMRRLARRGPNAPALTKEAQGLLGQLLRAQGGWAYGHHNYGPSQPGTQQRWASRRAAMDQWRAQSYVNPWLSVMGLGGKSAQETLPEPVFGVLEAAAFQYNRVLGLLSVADDRLGKMANTIQAAIDEAIADVFHQAAMLQSFPESSGATRKVCEDRTASLREIADRVEALQRREPTLTERLSYTSAVDEALEELRLQTMAESELLHNEKNPG